MAEARNLFPIALDVRGRRCVIVGGGNVAARKASSLLECGASVAVVAPEAGAEVREAAVAGRLEWVAEAFTPGHLDGAFLVVAATDSPAVNAAVRDAARERGVLLNQAAPAGDGKETALGDFATMAAVRRGDLLLAVTTGGSGGPTVANRARRELEAAFGPHWEAYTALLGELRRIARARIPDRERRAAVLRQLAEDDGLFERVRNGEYGAAREEALEWLSR